MNLKPREKTISQMPGCYSVQGLRLWVGQRDENFDMFRVAKGDGKHLYLEILFRMACCFWKHKAGSWRIKSDSQNCLWSAELVFGRQVQWHAGMEIFPMV